MRLFNLVRVCFWISLLGVWVINVNHRDLELVGILLYLIPFSLLIPYGVLSGRRR